MQIRKPVVPKFFFLNAFPFFGEMSLPQTEYFSISKFLYKLTQPIVKWCDATVNSVQWYDVTYCSVQTPVSEDFCEYIDDFKNRKFRQII